MIWESRFELREEDREEFQSEKFVDESEFHVGV